MIILVDFENTHVSGLDGYEYLNDTDTLVMYYSDENSAVTQGMVDDLKKHNVHVSLVKLLKQHSNALDMYIASTTGMFLETGEKICIVSKDKGYAAVRDFWHSLRGAEILLGETIKECFLNSEKIDDERIKLCKERAQKATLVDSFATMNTIPTKPTLSRANQRRKSRNINFTLVSEPASLIPNPLMMETPADQLAKQMQSMTETQSKDATVIVDAQDTQSAQTSRETKGEQAAQSSHESRNTRGSRGTQVAQTKNDSDNNQKSGNGRSGNDSNRANGKNQSDRSSKANGNNARANGDAGRNDDSRSGETGVRDIRRGRNSRSDTQTRNHAKSDVASESMSHGGYDGIGKVNEASRLENLKRAESQEDKKSIIKSEPEKTAIIPHKEPKTALAKSEPKFDPNRVQFVYDPVSHSMKKVGIDSGSDKSGTRDARPAKSSAYPASNKGDDTSEVSLSDVSLSDATVTEKPQDADTALEKSQDTATAAEVVTKVSDATIPNDDNAEVKTSDNAVAEAKTDSTEVETKDAATAESETSGEPKKTTRKTAAKKAGRTRKTAAKKSTSAKAKSSAAETSAKADAPDVDASKAENADETKTLAEGTKETSTTTRKKVGRPRKTAAKSKTRKAAKESNDDKATAESKTEKDVKDATAEKADTKAQAATAVTDSPESAAAKFGATANTLHTYYVRLMKAYGKEQGRILYDASKKMVQEDIKKRKAADKTTEKAADKVAENVADNTVEAVSEQVPEETT